MPQQRPYLEVDVFGAEPLAGNPVAVVVDSDGFDTAGMQRFARWTNLSETTFLLPPTDPAADYRVRIFTPARELPFAGHPTLGSAAAWLDAGGVPAASGTVVQECGVGLVTLRNGGGGLAFRAPDLLRSGSVDAETLAQATRSLRLTPDDIVDAAWVDNGPGWLALLLADADTVLGLRPDLVAMGDLKLGVVGPYPQGLGAADVEVRACVPSVGVGEGPGDREPQRRHRPPGCRAQGCCPTATSPGRAERSAETDASRWSAGTTEPGWVARRTSSCAARSSSRRRPQPL